ncbi:MAG: PQQ-binding-like beta-propeller repeat protein [Candidatus Solibacter sp.]
MKKTLLVLAAAPLIALGQPYTSWTQHLGGADSPQYSALTQINKSNVARLEQAWFYPAGDNGFRFGFNPTVTDGVMYVMGEHNAVVALNAATGKVIWEHPVGDGRTSMNHRGVAYWENKDRSDRRILFAAGDQLQAVDARTGKAIQSFGDNGKVNLRVGLGRDPEALRRVQSGDPGRIFENLIILGSAPGEEYEAPPGDLRAYNVLTGKLAWTFHTVPHPGEPGYDTWPPEAWKYVGGVNTWGEISIDEKRGIAYFPLGSPTYDFYGADRKGSNLYSDSLLALDARTGKYLWHFQMVHHDLWDYDLVAAPKLLTIKRNGKDVDVVAQTTKQGFVFVFDRVTGKPVWPIEERKVPQSDVPGEASWPTQPFPTAPPPFSRQKFTADDVNPHLLDPAEIAKYKDVIKNSRNLGLFTPPAMVPTMEIPGNNGGANWGSTAIDPKRGWLYVASKEHPSMLKLEEAPNSSGTFSVSDPPAQVGKEVYLANCQQCHKADLTGQMPEVPPVTGVIAKLGADEVKRVVKSGQGNMPGFKLSDLELDRLLTYLRNPAAADRAGAPAVAPRPVVTPLLTPGSPKRYWTGYNYMVATDGISALKPPFWILSAYDLNQGTLQWQIPVGEVPELVARGIRNTGSMATRGGPVVTASGLVFTPSMSDKTLYAYDAESGKTLWSKQVGASPDGVPSVYEVGGKQYLVICASDRDVPRVRAGQAAPPADPNKKAVQGYYVFTLPVK